MTSSSRLKAIVLVVWSEICSGTYNIRVNVGDPAERDDLIGLLCGGSLGKTVKIPDFGVHIDNRVQVHVVGSRLVQFTELTELVRVVGGLTVIEGRLLR